VRVGQPEEGGLGAEWAGQYVVAMKLSLEAK
jgi:hypothetical protein